MLAGWLLCSMAGRLAAGGWLVSWLAGCWLAIRPAGWLLASHADWQATGWLAAWLAGELWLARWLTT